MLIYFQAISEAWFEREIRPALAESWRSSSFKPCQPLCGEILARVKSQTPWLFSDELLAVRVLSSLPFDRAHWRLLVGEVLLLCAEEVPYIPITPETLCCLLAPEEDLERPSREAFAPVHEALFGAKDLVFGGGFYRPDQAGYNGRTEVARLADSLLAVDPPEWSADALMPLTILASAAEREEELEFVRDWFGALQHLYQQAREREWIVVCESV